MSKASKYFWTCGHIGGSTCLECHRELASRANELAEENIRLREEVEQLKGRVLYHIPVAKDDD